MTNRAEELITQLEAEIARRMSGMTESARVKKINELLGERYRNKVSGRHYLMIRDFNGLCTLEGIDRRVIDVARETLDSPNSAWERLT